MSKPVVVFIAGERQHAGKTVTSLGIISALCNHIDPADIGYFKPVGQELVTLPNGERIMPNLSTGPLLNDLPIRHFQLVQKTTELIEARLVVDRPLTESEETALADYYNKGWRHEFNFVFIYLDEIARGANGKYEVFRCDVSTA